MPKPKDAAPLGLNAIHERLSEARTALGDAPGEDKFADTTIRMARATLDGLKRAILEKQVADMDDTHVSVPLPIIRPRTSDE